MHISVIGAGYVGLVTGTCLAEIGHQVHLIEIDQKKVNMLRKGVLPIYEPQLQPLLERNLARHHLKVFERLEEGVSGTDIIFLALPTPPQKDGSSDLQYLLGAIKDLAAHIKGYTIIITKSTVPVGTTLRVKQLLQQHTKEEFDVVSNPEFLREGTAVYDFLKPQRIVIGTSSQRARLRMKELYASFATAGSPILFMDEASSEMSKYAANAFLATKISFINEIAGLCSHLGADIKAVQQALSMDERIGKHFLKSGLGYGGSCLPKDVAALLSAAVAHQFDPSLIRAVRDINNQQHLILWQKAQKYFQPPYEDLCFAIWGLTFKPGTDDLREAPALSNIEEMKKAGITLRVFDPVAMDRARSLLGDTVHFAVDPYEALEGVDALFIMTEWPIFNALSFEEMKKRMRHPCIFDGRGIYEAEDVAQAGLKYHTITSRS